MWVWVFAGGIGLGVGIAAWLLLSSPRAARRAVRRNLDRGVARQEARPARLPQGRSTLGRLAPTAWHRRTAQRMARAGFGPEMTPDRVLAIKLLGMVIAGLFGALLISRTEAPWAWAVTAGLVILAFFLPEILAYNAATKRRDQIDLELPDMLDQMSIAVSAGLGFDAAMMRVARVGSGALAEEFVRTLQDLHVGKTRRAAYEDLNARTSSVPLRRFTRTIVQAEAYGLALVDVLTTHADELRDIRKQTAERKAMAIPVKVTFPLIVSILPALFIVVLGPAVVNIATQLMGR